MRRITIEVNDWKRFFLSAYRSHYPEVVIGFANCDVHDVYTDLLLEQNPIHAEMFFRYNIHPKISEAELEKRLNEEYDFIYLQITDVEEYNLTFCVYDAAVNVIRAIYVDGRHRRLILDAISEISKLCLL